MAVFPLGVQKPVPFAALLHREVDETYSLDRGLSLEKFLLLVLHRRSYSLEKDRKITSCTKEVHDVISRLCQEICRGAPPKVPPIPVEKTTPRVKGLLPAQMSHLAAILMQGDPIFLKNPDGRSPYDPSLWKDIPFGSRFQRELPTPPPVGVLAGGPVSYFPSPHARKERIDFIERWFEFCFEYRTEDGIRYVVGREGSILFNQTDIIDQFVRLVLKDNLETAPAKLLLKELKRRRVPYPGGSKVEVNLFRHVLIPAIIDSQVSIMPLTL